MTLANEAEVPVRRVVAALGCGAFVLLAVLLEMLSGQSANTLSAARYEAFVPLGWPTPLRVLWWLLVAAAAGAHRRLLHPRPGRREQVLTTVATLPFVAFAIGVALGAPWATWH